MFDLKKAIAQWRCSLKKGGKIGRETVDELESHVYDQIYDFVSAGWTEQAAFEKAVARLGDVDELDEEFSKVHAGDGGLVETVEGQVLIMSSGKMVRGERFTTILLFIGFCGIIGWVGTTCWMLQGWTNLRHWASTGIALRTIAGFSLSTSFFLAFALIGIGWGLKLLRRSEYRMKSVVRSLVPALVLSPVYILLGMAIILSVPWWGGWIRAAFVGHRIVQSQWSPDGVFEAYVVDKPSFDPPNHHLYIRSKNVSYSEKIAELLEDVDSIRRIHWSPDSDIVVFQTWFNLVAVRVSDYKMIKIPLGGVKHWRENGTFWVDYDDVRRPEIIEFPASGTFSYRLERSNQLKTLEMESF